MVTTADKTKSEKPYIADFYMGGNGADGFFCFFDELEKPDSHWRSYLIKGGAGTGKSSLIKRTLAECGESGLVERVHCSSDPNSLDGVLLYDKKISMVDATPPHVIEPVYPGGYQTVINLCEYFDEKKLASRMPKITEYQKQNTACHKKCCSYLRCAWLLQKENKEYIEQHTDLKKVETLALRIVKKELRTRGTGASEHRRLLSAVTNEGVNTFYETVAALADRVYVLRDEYGVSSARLLEILRDFAIKNDHEVYTCVCPLGGRDDHSMQLEHLFIPALRLGFVTENRYHSFEKIQPCGVISYMRFTDKEALRQKRQILRFNKIAVSELVTAAVDALVEAKKWHDLLEGQYTDAVDFKAVTKKADSVIAKIK